MVARERAPDEEETYSIRKNLLTDPQAGLTALEFFWEGGRYFGFLKEIHSFLLTLICFYRNTQSLRYL